MLPSRSSHCNTCCVVVNGQQQAHCSFLMGSPSTKGVCPRIQVPIDPIGKLPGLLDALKLMDAAVQQNMYHEKLLMYRNVRMPDQDKVLVCTQIVPAGHCLAELPVGRCMLSCATAPIMRPFIVYPICTSACMFVSQLSSSWCKRWTLYLIVCCTSDRSTYEKFDKKACLYHSRACTAACCVHKLSCLHASWQSMPVDDMSMIRYRQ